MVPDPVWMLVRDLIHLFLAIPTLAGVGIFLIPLVNAGSSDLSDRDGISGSLAVIGTAALS